MSADNGQILVNAVQTSVDLNQNSEEVEQNSVIFDNWPLVKSGVFVDWANNIQLNAKVKHN